MILCVAVFSSSEFYIMSCTFEGAQLELMAPDLEDVASFVGAWITAASEAQGQATKTIADLEPLESQEKLMSLISSCANGIGSCRKSLTQLGHEPALPDVLHILEEAARQRFWRKRGESEAVDQGQLLVFMCQGYEVRRRLQETHQNRAEFDSCLQPL